MSMSNKLPQGWVECKLGDIVEYKKGKKPKVLQAEYSEGLLPYVDIKCFEKNILYSKKFFLKLNEEKNRKIYLAYSSSKKLRKKYHHYIY